MKSTFLILLVAISMVSSNDNKFYFFRIDENISLENIKFKKEIGRSNRIIKVKNTKSIDFNLNIDGKNHDYKLKRNWVSNINSLSIKKEKANKKIQINRGHITVSYLENEIQDFSLIIDCFSIVKNGDEFNTKSKEYNTEIKSNPSFFFE